MLKYKMIGDAFLEACSDLSTGAYTIKHIRETVKVDRLYEFT